MIPCTRTALLVAVLAVSVIGCRDAPPEPVIDRAGRRPTGRTDGPPCAEPDASASGPTGSDAAAISDKTGAPGVLDPAAQDLLGKLTRDRAVRALPISRRSLSLRLSLKGGRRAAFKPLLRDKPIARYEVAAFRVNRLLGLTGVPPAVMKRIPLDNFEWLLGAEHADVNAALREQADLDDRSGVWGAAIVWIDDLEPAGFEGPAGMERLARLLALGGPPAEQEPLVAEASALVVFDYVTGNWDRFSGGNLFRAPGGGRLILLDNNGAFARWSETKQERMDHLLGLVFRFSKRLVQTLRSLSTPDVERALEQEPWHRQRRLLTRREVALLFERRDALLARVDALAAEHGRDRILSLP